MKRTVWTLLAVLLVAGTAQATTYVMVADEDLVDGAAMIARVRVTGREVVGVGTRIFTDFVVEPQRILKGSASGPLRLRRPGGVLPGGRVLFIDGMPELRPGAEALVFLVSRDDGTWGFEHFLLGSFHVIELKGRTVAYRNAAGALLDTDSPARRARRSSLLRAHLPRDLGAFEDWIADRAAGFDRDPDYYLDDAVLPAQIPARFTLFDDGAGNNFHWHPFSPGVDGSVTWMMDKTGIKGLKGKGATAVKKALKKWAKVFNVETLWGGKTKAKDGLVTRDGLNTVLFGDPNDEIDGDFSCTTGGTLAIGGFQGATGPPHAATGSGKKRSYWDIIEGDVVFQKGVDCAFGSRLLDANKYIEEITGHEVGHANGLRHSCGDDASGACTTTKKDEALMRASVHADDRGAKLNGDDKGGAKALDYKR